MRSIDRIAPLGKRNSISSLYSITNNVHDTTQYYIILALRMNSSYSANNMFRIIDFNMLSTGSKLCYYTIQLHSTVGPVGAANLGTALTYTRSVPGSIVEYANGTDSTQYVSTPGYILTSGYLNNSNNIQFNTSDYELLLKRTTVTEYDTIYITGRLTSGTNETLKCGVDFIENI